MDSHLKLAGDIAAGSTVVATLLGWLPPIAAALTIIYTAFRLYVEIEARLEKKRGRRDRKDS